jgi:3-hydroxyanthranilate 3,4-dioxygenase
MPSNTPLNLRAWIEENRSLLRPPVGNKMVWKDHSFMVMVVGGPNLRKDYHINPTEEFFHQIEGNITLRILEDGKPRDIPIREGEIFLLPANVPHSPQRPEGTVGMVVEHARPEGANDHLAWFCEKCGEPLYDEEFRLVDLGAQLKPVIEKVKADESLRTCKECGVVLEM